MLYGNFMRQITAIDPDLDPTEIDTSLEPEEAMHDLRRKGKLRGASKKEEFNPMKEYRSSLFDMGIKHPSMQSFIMRQDSPASQDDLDLVSYVMGARPHKNIKMDIARRARPAKSVKQWAKAPNRFDISGVDTPGSIFSEDWF
jgi:hypothetical protein